jgi:hypothetical protein
MFDASQQFLRYTSKRAGTAYLQNMDPLRARIGMTGLITQYFGFLGMVGWGTTFSHASSGPAQNYDGLIGQAQLTFYPTPAPGLADQPREASLTLSQIGLGYTRDFTNSYFGSYYTRDRGYLSVSYFFAGRVLTVLEGGVSRVFFPALYFPNGATRSGSFAEMRIDSSLFAEYRITDSLGLNATLTYDMNKSKKVLTTYGDPTNPRDDLSWNRFTAFLGFRWFM